MNGRMVAGTLALVGAAVPAAGGGYASYAYVTAALAEIIVICPGARVDPEHWAAFRAATLPLRKKIHYPALAVAMAAAKGFIEVRLAEEGPILWCIEMSDALGAGGTLFPGLVIFGWR